MTGSWYHHSVRHRRIGTFVAPDPAHDNVQAEFNVETYLRQPRVIKMVRGVNPAQTKFSARYAIKSERDGQPRFLPEVLALLWLNGELPATSLPLWVARTTGRYPPARERTILRSRDYRTLLGAGIFCLSLTVLGWSVQAPLPAFFAAVVPWLVLTLIVALFFLPAGLAGILQWRRAYRQLDALRREMGLPTPPKGFRPDLCPTAERFGLK